MTNKSLQLLEFRRFARSVRLNFRKLVSRYLVRIEIFEEVLLEAPLEVAEVGVSPSAPAPSTSPAGSAHRLGECPKVRSNNLRVIDGD